MSGVKTLYRKYRPQIFSDVIGQSSAVSILTNSIMRGTVGHAYLFSGSRGCGKTSVARIFAKSLNCLNRNGFEPCGECSNCVQISSGNSLDVIEIDGASNNGVDSIRNLRDNVGLVPFTSRYKIYIIDEVHMLTISAFNALLKTLEEPPEHVIFIMATTEPHKVPVTIRSRCQHIPFRSITPDDIFSRLEFVCNNENIAFEPEALREISRQADGALRDALSLLEQVSAMGDITLANVESAFGAGSRVALQRWVTMLRERPESAYAELVNMFHAGASGVRLFEELFSVVRDLWLVAKWPGITESLRLSSQEKDFLTAEAKLWTAERANHLAKSVLTALTEAKAGSRGDILVGIFSLSFEVVREAVPAQHRQSLPDIDNAPTPKMPVIDDASLREKLLNASLPRNFFVYCALFDANVRRRDDELVIELNHRYCFEVLKIDRVSAGLSEMFGVQDVVLRFGEEKYSCPRGKFEAARKFQPVQETAQETVPQEPPSAKKETRSFIGDILSRLTIAGLKPELIMVKPAAANDDDNDTSQGDEDNDA